VTPTSIDSLDGLDWTMPLVDLSIANCAHECGSLPTLGIRLVQTWVRILNHHAPAASIWSSRRCPCCAGAEHGIGKQPCRPRAKRP
jgi:hypothetical protein